MDNWLEFTNFPPQGRGFGIHTGLVVLYSWELELSHQSGDRQKIA